LERPGGRWLPVQCSSEIQARHGEIGGMLIERRLRERSERALTQLVAGAAPVLGGRDGPSIRWTESRRLSTRDGATSDRGVCRQSSDQGRQACAVSNAITRLHREYHGRGATTTRTVIQRNYVVAFLEDIYTPVDRTLLDAGEQERIGRRARGRSGGALRAQPRPEPDGSVARADLGRPLVAQPLHQP
jgi:hypothetical protein